MAQWKLVLGASVMFSFGCPADDSGGDVGNGTTDAGDDDDEGPTTLTTSTTASTSDSATDDTTTAGPTTDSTGPGDESSGGSSGGTEGTTGGELCMIDLPPGPECPFAPPPKPGRAGAPAPSGDAWPELDEVLPDEVPGGAFIMEPDGGGVAIECDVFAQDCAEGEKCLPWANDGGGSWNATHCTPIDPNPVEIGETCIVQGSGVSGVDNCVLGAMCWDVDPETNEGTCVEQCSCSPETPICETANTTCTIANDGVIALCLPVCNPLDAAACPDGQGCVPIGDLFGCAPDASGQLGAAGDPCEYLNACDPGLFCAAAASVPNCGGGSPGCCSSFCTIGDDGSCLAGQSCVAWYAEGQAPDACLGTIGACTVL